MRITPLPVVSLLATTLLVATGCKSTPDSNGDGAYSESTTTEHSHHSTSLEHDLLAVKPHLDRTMAALDSVVANAETPGLAPAMSEFRHELASLRRSADRVIADLDAKRRHSDAFFLDRDRTVATTGQPGVLAGRDRVGFVGEYLVQLRRDYQSLRENLDNIEATLGSATTAADVNRASDDIAAANRNRVNVDNDITVLVEEMRNVDFGR